MISELIKYITAPYYPHHRLTSVKQEGSTYIVNMEHATELFGSEVQIRVTPDGIGGYQRSYNADGSTSVQVLIIPDRLRDDLRAAISGKFDHSRIINDTPLFKGGI